MTEEAAAVQVWERNVWNLFWKAGEFPEIWCALVSHGDNDHISGLVELLGTEAEIKIHNLILPGVGKERRFIRSWSLWLKEKGADVFYMESGDRISRGGLELHCLFGGDPIGGTTDRNKAVFSGRDVF